MFGYTQQELDFISRLKETGLLGTSAAHSFLFEIERAKRSMEKLKPVSFYESLNEDARKGFDYATGRKRFEPRVVAPKVRLMSMPEQIERLEKLAERVERLAEQVNGENYAQSQNEYEN
ncbi:MAG TPA: hypothetical protein VK308_12420 [Pyrinomonadaceae bacterium]|nr:hypothetical protein [Pyrinomonadaceae bacterium]